VKRAIENEKVKKVIATNNASLNNLPKPVVGFWAGDLNNFQFIDPIIERLKEYYNVRKFEFDRNNLQALSKNLSEVDLAWFDWANDAVVPASFNGKIDIPFICRLHRYEVYGTFPTTINWKRINKLVFVSDSVRESFRSNYPDYLNDVESVVISNGVDLEKFNGDLARPNRKNIAYLGRLHYIKNPSLLLQCFAAIAKKDPECKFHVAGAFGEFVIKEYFWDQVKKLGLEDSLTYYGKIDNPEIWLRDMDYMVLPSIIEGGPVSILEGMASGVKPVVANYLNAEKFLPKEFLFNTVEECVDIIVGEDLDRSSCRQHVEEHNNFEDQVKDIKNLIDACLVDAGYFSKHSANPIAADWNILIGESRFLTHRDKEIFEDRLLASNAEILMVKVVYPILDNHLIGRWEIGAVKNTIKTNLVEELDCSAICLEEIHLPYNDALEPFLSKQFQEALKRFVELFRSSINIQDKSVYAKWLALCLIELGRNQEALDILSDSLQLNLDDTDLYYLYLKVSLLNGDFDGIDQVVNTIFELGEATSYPEFICNVQEKTKELIDSTTADRLSA
jgi:glycosyltransferase involved in cell wall biosynthesis